MEDEWEWDKRKWGAGGSEASNRACVYQRLCVPRLDRNRGVCLSLCIRREKEEDEENAPCIFQSPFSMFI